MHQHRTWRNSRNSKICGHRWPSNTGSPVEYSSLTTLSRTSRFQSCCFPGLGWPRRCSRSTAQVRDNFATMDAESTKYDCRVDVQSTIKRWTFRKTCLLRACGHAEFARSKHARRLFSRIISTQKYDHAFVASWCVEGICCACSDIVVTRARSTCSVSCLLFVNMPQESAVQDMIDAVNNCYLAMRKVCKLHFEHGLPLISTQLARSQATTDKYKLLVQEAALMNNEVFAERADDIANLENKQTECEENFRRAQNYVQQWQRNLAEVC